MSGIRLWLALAVATSCSATLCAAPPALIEVQLGPNKLQGKVVAHNTNSFWLLGQDGRLRALRSDEVGKFHQVSPRFNGWTGTILREQLRREFGQSFDVVGTRHYVVCAKGEQKARAYADTFEELFRSFHMYFSVRGFKIDEPEFPLVAVIFPEYESFARYAKAENVQASPTLKGYYLTTSNRIALYEDRLSTAAWRSPVHSPWDLPPPSDGERSSPRSSGWPVALEGQSGAWEALEGSLKDTMIHEATHQAAFNSGLHSRIGENPKWIVEGLATVFEAPGIRNSSSNSGVKARINRERFVWFGNFAKTRRKAKSLENFLASDAPFATGVLDAYSEAWAFSFFLIETRPRAYAEYLRTIAARDPLQTYPPEARVDDFKKLINKELPLLESEFLRFIAGIK